MTCVCNTWLFMYSLIHAFVYDRSIHFAFSVDFHVILLPYMSPSKPCMYVYMYVSMCVCVRRIQPGMHVCMYALMCNPSICYGVFSSNVRKTMCVCARVRVPRPRACGCRRLGADRCRGWRGAGLGLHISLARVRKLCVYTIALPAPTRTQNSAPPAHRTHALPTSLQGGMVRAWR